MAKLVFVRILHIDDSPEICKLYSDMFTAQNNSIKNVNDGREGLVLVLKNDYDLILLDMCMPKYSGMDFLRDLKEQRPSELKKIVITSLLHFNEAHVKGLMQLGIHSVEEKPTYIQEMEILQKNVSQNMGKISMRILIIDDSLETTTMLSEFFKSKGFQTVVTNDPWEGLKRIQQERFDVILLDIVMPVFNGLQIIATLASEEILQDQNIFIYSANFGHDTQIKDLLRRDGINGCLKKPMDLNEILETITKKFELEKTITS
jgi:CheY-like chemotaxis protein